MSHLSKVIVRIIPNAFDREGREVFEIAVPTHGETIDIILSKLPQPVPEDTEKWILTSSRYGKVHWDRTGSFVALPGDEVVVTPKVEDPISVSVAAFAAAGGGFLGTLAAIGTFVGIVALHAAVSFGINKLVNHLLGGGDIRPNSADSSISDSPTYGWDGIQTTANEGIPVPIVFGRHRVGGNIINEFIDSDDDENQFLYMLLALSEGPVQSIAGITTDTDFITPPSGMTDEIIIDGNNIGNLTDVTLWTRMGNDDQTIILPFNQLHHLQDHNVEFKKGVVHVFTTLLGDVENIILHFFFPSLIQFKNGRTRSTGVAFKIETRISGSADPWFVWADGPPAEGPWAMPGDRFEVRERTPSAVRRSFTIEPLDPERYDIRITRLSSDSRVGDDPDDPTKQRDAFLSAIDEVTLDQLSYPCTALLGIRLRATEQISGNVSGVSTLVEGMKVLIPDRDSGGGLTHDPPLFTSGYTRNPIWNMYNLLTNRRWGLGRHMNVPAMSVQALLDDADYADELVEVPATGDTETRFLLDIVLDSQQSALDWIAQICTAFRCLYFYSDGAIHLVIDKPEPVGHLFGMGNIKSGTFRVSYASYNATPNQVEIQFLNQDNFYEREITAVDNEEELALGLPFRRRQIFLPGITRLTEATRLGRYILNYEKTNIRVVSFTTTLESLQSQATDVVEIAHHLPAWSVGSGRVLSGTASTFSVYESIPFPALTGSDAYIVRVYHEDDTIEERIVTNTGSDVTRPAGYSYSVSPAFSTAPADYEKYVFGTTSLGGGKPYRLNSILRNNNDEYDVTAIEYNAEVYNDNTDVVSVPNYTYLPDPRHIPDPMSDVKLTPIADYSFALLLSFSRPLASADAGFFDHADIEISYDGALWEGFGSTRSNSIRLENLEPFRTVSVRLIPVSKWGVRGLASQAETATGVPSSPAPRIVEGLELKSQANDHEFRVPSPTFTWREYSYARLDQPAGEETHGAGTGSRSRYFDGYDIEVFTLDDQSIGQSRRKERIYNNEFTYHHSQNIADHLSAPDALGRNSPRRQIFLAVTERDQFGGKSRLPSLLYVYNHPPPALHGDVHTDKPDSDHFQCDLVSLSGNPFLVTLAWLTPDDQDVSGYLIYRRENSSIPTPNGLPDSTYLWLNTSSNRVQDFEIPKTSGDENYYLVAAYDSFSKDHLNYLGQFSIDSTGSVTWHAGANEWDFSDPS